LIREISRRSGLSRNTVRKYLRADSVEPGFYAPDRPKLDPYADKLAAMLRVETASRASTMIPAPGAQQISLTDPDARAMATGADEQPTPSTDRRKGAPGVVLAIVRL